MATTSTNKVGVDVSQTLTNKSIDGLDNTLSNIGDGAWEFVSSQTIVNLQSYITFINLTETAKYMLIFEGLLPNGTLSGKNLLLHFGTDTLWWDSNQYQWNVSGWNGGSFQGVTGFNFGYVQLTRDGVDVDSGCKGEIIFGPMNSAYPVTTTSLTSFMRFEAGEVLESLDGGSITHTPTITSTNATRIRLLWSASTPFAGQGTIQLYKQKLTSQ